MNLLFLRGQVPRDRDPRQIMYSNLEDCCDVWTQLAYHLLKDEDYGELWYWGGKRKVRYKHNFVERWLPSYTKHKISFQPDIIFARGGFPQYDPVLAKHPKAFKIYYGAGQRFLPKYKFKKYQLILVDTPTQLENARSKFETRCELFTKPAADNIFYPMEREKEYDVIFSSNEHKKGIKGHGFILPIWPNDLKMVQTGIVSKSLRKQYRQVRFTGWLPRKQLREWYARSKVAIVCCTSVDSCPRVIPEALACNCPLLVLDSVNLWQEKYLQAETGKMTNKANFIKELRLMVKQYKDFSPRKYYDEHLSLQVASQNIRNFWEST